MKQRPDAQAKEHGRSMGVETLVECEHADRPIRATDAQIAAICRVHGATRATRNTKGFGRAGVQMIDPREAS